MFGQLLNAQDDVYTIVKTMPEFPGGTSGLAEYLSSNINYPVEAREANYSGRSYVKFIVDTTGRVLSPVVIKSSGHKCLDDEAIRVVKAMPKWTAGRDSINKVKVSINIPVNFKYTVIKTDTPPGQPKLSAENQEKHDKAMKFWNDGHKLEQQGDFKDALEEFNKSLSVESENKYAMFDKAKMHMVLGEDSKACEIWNKMVQSNIRKNEAEEFIKTYCVENGSAKMVKYYEKLRASYFFDQGMVTLRTGRYEAALSKFDSCLKYNPEHTDALFNKAQMHFKLEQKKAACNSWKKLLALNPSDKEVEELIKKHCN